MTRNLVALAMETGIPMSEWERAGERVIATAWDLLEEAADNRKG